MAGLQSLDCLVSLSAVHPSASETMLAVAEVEDAPEAAGLGGEVGEGYRAGLVVGIGRHQRAQFGMVPEGGSILGSHFCIGWHLRHLRFRGAFVHRAFAIAVSRVAHCPIQVGSKFSSS